MSGKRPDHKEQIFLILKFSPHMPASSSKRLSSARGLPRIELKIGSYHQDIQENKDRIQNFPRNN